MATTYTVTDLTVVNDSRSNDTLTASWACSLSNIKEYHVKWSYYTTGGGWHNPGTGNYDTVTTKKSTYSILSSATKVRCKVKPVCSLASSKSGYWSGDYCDWVTVYINDTILYPEDIDDIDMSLNGTELTVSVSNVDTSSTTHVKFAIYQDNDSSTEYKSTKIALNTSYASWTTTVEDGHTYKARARGYNSTNDTWGNWSSYTSSTSSRPTSVSINTCGAASSTSVYLEWDTSSTAKTYTVQYATDSSYLTSGSNATSEVSTEETSYTITGLTSGETYYFRVRAVNSDGEYSSWSSVVSVILGKAPSAPTTWSSTTTAYIGETVYLYWVHNSKDGSSQTYGQIELTINGVTSSSYITVANSTDEDEKDNISQYALSTSGYSDSTVIKWRVRTKGVLDEYGDWSTSRTITVYSKPTLSLQLLDANSSSVTDLTSFPLYVKAMSGPSTQTPISYYIYVKSNETYETMDEIGITKYVSTGDKVYSKYFDVDDQTLMISLSADNIDLENGVSYTVYAQVTMNTGLSASDTVDFEVAWEDQKYYPDLVIAYEEDTYSTSLLPYCEEYEWVLYVVTEEDGVYVKTSDVADVEELDSSEMLGADYRVEETGELVYSHTTANGSTILYCRDRSEATLPVDNVKLSIYRREYNGDFTEIATGMDNTKTATTTDFHPALDYARYRVVAIATDTGAVSYYDAPGYPINETAVILQWSEDWSAFDTIGDETDLEDPSWGSGSLLRLPYNIDVADSNDPDVELVKYVGRKYPVSYYGTHLNSTSTWNMDVDKSDIDTLYSLRRLSDYMGDVYVREPSGSGYWASIKVSFSQKHKELVIPVTLEITRVEGNDAVES